MILLDDTKEYKIKGDLLKLLLDFRNATEEGDIIALLYLCGAISENLKKLKIEEIKNA